jgi:uroporphyrinogen decarboxylase
MIHHCDLLRVLKNEQPERRPIWLMRQAGRYLPEYLEVRKTAGSFLKLCYTPELAAEVTLQPLRRFDLDAAILFSDILVVPQAMGLDLAFVENEGPKLETVRDADGVRALRAGGRHDAFERVTETVARVRERLPHTKALIGFCGAPWTVASYMIEGGSSARQLAQSTALENPQWYQDMIAKIIDSSIEYLKMQVTAGAQALQIFDSWASDLDEALTERCIVAPISQIVEGVRAVFPDVPIIVFARGVGERHSAIAAGTRANGVSVEQGRDLGGVLGTLEEGVAVQGNLDPELLLGARDVLMADVARICSSVPKRRHIFNLGHGISQHTKPEAVTSVIAAVREYDGDHSRELLADV